MSEKSEALWTVTRAETGRVWIFRTRQAARLYVGARRDPDAYRIRRATWGPEA